VRDTNVRLTAATALLGVALLALLPAAAVAAPSAAPSPSSFGSAQFIKAGDFSEIAEAVDSNGKIHLAASDEQDVWYLTNRTGTWTAKRVFIHTGNNISGLLWALPTITLDSHDRVHMAATRLPAGGEGGLGIFYSTDQGRPRGVFGAPTQIGSNRLGEPQLKVYNGHLFLVAVKDWCCVGDGTVVMRTDKTGSWTQATIGRGQNPSFQMTANGFARVLYSRGDTATGLYYAVAGTHTGAFTTTHIPGTNGNDRNPLLALSGGDAQIAWQHGTSGAGNWKFTYATNSGWHSFFTVPGSTSSMAGAMTVVSSFFAHVELAGVNVTDHYRCGDEPPLVWCHGTVASNVHASAVAAASGPGKAVDVAWLQDGDIWFARDTFPGP